MAPSPAAMATLPIARPTSPHAKTPLTLVAFTSSVRTKGPAKPSSIAQPSCWAWCNELGPAASTPMRHLFNL